MASRQWRPSRVASSDQNSGKGQWQSQQKQAPPRPGDAIFAKALRNGSSSREEASQSQAQSMHSLVPYLPHDDAAAAGLSVEQGAVDPVQTQQVADIFNAELSALLRLTPREFWQRVTMDTTIHVSLGSYLQFRRRWYDFYLDRHGNAFGLVVGDQEMNRHVFMVLFRMSSNVEPGFSKTDCLSSEDHADIIQKKQLFDIPKLLDICAIYGHDNPDLTRRLVSNIFFAHQRLNADLADVVPILSNTVDTVHQRCFSTLSMLLATLNMETPVSVKLQQELLEVLQYLNDIIFSLQSFIEAYPSGVLILLSTGQSNSKEQLLPILAVIHDSLLPIIQRSLSCLGVANSKSTGVPVEPCFKRIRLGLLELVWRLLVLSYLSESNAADSTNATVNHLQKAIFCDPSARGEGFVQMVSNMVAGPFEGSSGDLTEGLISTGALLRNVERKHKILDRVDQLCSTGLISLDSAQYDYIVTLIRYTGPSASQTPDISRISVGEQTSIQMQESDIMYESKITHIKDILPDYGDGFIAACLEAYDNNPEEVIQRILENSLHPSLQSLDTTLQLKPDSVVSSISKKDKGKGKAIEAPSSESQNSKSLNNTSRDSIRNRPSSSLAMEDFKSDGLDQRLSSSVLASSSSGVPSASTEDMKGRFVRKEKGDGNATKFLDERDVEDASRIAAYAAQYDDEYDDSFDELGTHFADAVEETESLADLIRSKSSTGGSANVPQSSKILRRPRPDILPKVTRVRVDASISKAEMQSSNNQKAFFGKGNGNRFSDVNSTASSQTNRGRGRGRRDENRGQYFVKDGKNYSYKVAGSVRVSSVEEAEALKKVEEETINGLGRGGNVPSSVQQISGGRNMPGSEFGRSSRAVQNEFAGRGSSQSQGRGFPRKDHDNHHRKDRAMKKHFASIGGL